jgi:ABC-type multidrug transport system fused ATPase/permease subunit
MNDQSIIALLKHLWSYLSRRRRVQFGLLLLLMIVASLTEIISLGAILPFLSALTAPNIIFAHPSAQPLIHAFGISSPEQLLLPLTFAFCMAATLAGSVRLLLAWASTRLSFATGADLSINIYRRTLYQPYAAHVASNSSEVVNAIVTKTSAVISGVIGPTLSLISSTFMLIAIFAALLSVQPMISLAAFGGFGIIYGIVTWSTRTKKIRNSKRIARESTQVIKSLQEGLGGIRDVLIDGSQNVFCKIYRSADHSLRIAQGSNLFLAQAPRFGMEALGMVLIAVLAFKLAQQAEGISTAIPVLGALAIGAQRMLPLMQLTYNSLSNIQGSQASLRDTLNLLDRALPAYADQLPPAPLLYQEYIRLNKISFRYSPEMPWVIRELNLTIAKGSRVGFIGATGSGKSTLLDIVMGLLAPTEGVLAVDGQVITIGNQRAWQEHIAHVPQAIFLADSTIEENIAFGQPKSKIDHQRVIQAAKQAQIAGIIEKWPDQYETFVGERGIRLSGGQRQRIGIARALYKRADVIIFDEATSALDNETEQAVMEAIEGLSDDLTVLIIAHRLTTLKNCTQIVELGDGGIRRIGSYQDIVINAV